MKKLLFSAAVMALAFFAASCQQENLEPTSGANTVTYTVQVPDAIATKAIGDDFNGVDKVYYEVYREADIENNGQPVYEGSEDVDANGKSSFSLEFVKNQNFIVLFWAQNSALVKTDENPNGMYDINDLRAVKLVNPGAANNESAQVFAGKDIVDNCRSEVGGNVELTRPVSQINVFTTKESLNLRDSQIILVKSSMTVSGMYNTYNVAAGEAVPGSEYEAEYIYSLADVPETKDTDEYAYVAMNYVGFAYGDNTIVDVDFTIKTNESEEISHSVSNVPVKPNYRTNIIGNLITGAADYKVTLDATWVEGNHSEVLVSTASDLQTEINNINDGETCEIKLTGDIDFSDIVGSLVKSSDTPASLIIPAGRSVILNLNGYTITQTVAYAGHSMIVNNGTLTLNGKGTIRYTYNGTPDASYSKGNQAISNFGTLALNGSTVENATEKMTHAFFAVDTREGATFTVADGAVKCENGTAVRMGQFGSNSNKMTVTGGLICGNRAIQIHLPSSTATVNPIMSLNVQGGVLETKDETYNIGLYVYSAGQSAENVKVNIGGSTVINGSILVDEVTTDSMKDNAIQIAGGVINGKYGVYSYSADVNKADAVISVVGGTFAVEPAYVDPSCEVKEENDKYVIVNKSAVAMIGDAEYWSLTAAVAAVQDGETITLVADEVFTESNRTHNSGTWYDGLYYIGDKSFTIDLGGKSITQNGAVNDYLLNFKNDGTKANTITLKNGTVDAGTAAFCALCTSSVQERQLTINLENITLYNNMSNGSTVKLRGGAILNVKEGAKIVGKNSYLGIECIASTVNIYDGAELYMQGKTSYNGCLAGVGSNGIINVYGGYGKGVKGGFIAMTSGGTINVAGGEWIANTDGNVGSDSNWYVLTAQSNKYESGFAGPSIINVTGGTFRGGMDAWVLNNIEGERAELNISGGNFNVNPTRFLVKGYKVVEEDAIYNVVLNPVGVSTFEDLVQAAKSSGKVILSANIEMTETISLANPDFYLDGNGYTITQAEACENKYALFDITGGKAQFKNVTFDGVKGGAVVRTSGVEFNAENVTAKNGNHTQVQGIFRLLGKSTLTNCTFKNNTCKMAVTLNFDTDSNPYYQVVENCVFENNTCGDTAVLYYVCGTGCTVNGNVFENNTVTTTGNAATVYMGFTENHTITNNIFKGNSVKTTHATSNRATGGLMIGYEAVVTGNAFVDNSITAEGRNLGNDVCASVYYTDIDLSGNYWGGNAPVENDDYYVEYSTRNSVIINDYLTSYQF